MRHVLVTGAAGFIGSYVAEALLRDGARVTGVDSFDDFYSSVIKRSNVEQAAAHSAFELVEADIRDEARMERLFSRGVDAVVHLAARAGVRPSIENPMLYQDVNVRGTCVLLEAARKHGVKRFVFASSSSVYGNNPKAPFSESDNVDHPISPYAATKKAGELICHTYHHLFATDITCLRFFTVYGPRQRPDLAIHKFARLIEAGKSIPMFGDGSMRRDYTYVQDIVAGVLAALERCDGYHIYNLGNSSPVSLSELIRSLEQVMGKKAQIERLPTQAGDVERTFADITAARRDLGYEPKTDFAAGLKAFVEWMREGR
jgi:UDP-glucuronate 4-epimerase